MQLERWAQQPHHQRLGHGIGHTHTQFQRPAAAGPALEAGLHLAPEGKDVARIVQRQPAELGQRQLAPLPHEQGVAERILQLLDLAAQGLRREMQLLGRARDAASLGHMQKVLEVLVVHHGGVAIIRFIRSIF